MHPLSSNSSGENQPIPHKNEQVSPLQAKTDEIANKTEKSQKTSSNKEINVTSEPKYPKVSNLTHQKILEKYQESPDDDPEIDEEGMDELYKALDKFILPISKDSIFYGTDLIVIDDSFTGNLPLNGIKQSELAHTEQLFKKICDGKENMRIIAADANDPFKHETENLIRMLLTRKIGRKLIQKIIESSFLPKLELVKGKKCCFRVKELKISLPSNEDRSISLASHPSGKLKSQDTPLFIVLAHELVHATHFPHLRNTLNTAPTFSHKYDNLEEQMTITGLKGDLFLEENKMDDESWDPSESFNQDLQENYDELNERNITAAFTNSQNVYYPRFSHKGLIDRIIQIKPIENYTEIELDKLREYIISLVKQGVVLDVEEIYKLNIIDINKLFYGQSPPLIFSAVISEEIEMIRFLINKGFNISENYGFRTNALNYLIQSENFSKNPSEYLEIIKFLLENKLDFKFPKGEFEYDLNFIIEVGNIFRINNPPEIIKLYINQFFKDCYLLRMEFLIDEIRNGDKKYREFILDCAVENLEKVLVETHASLNPLQHEFFTMISDKLIKLGVETTKLNQLLTNSNKSNKSDL